MATLKYLNPSYVEGGSEPKYVSVPLLSTKNDEISIGTDTPGNKEKVWINSSTGAIKYKDGDIWKDSAGGSGGGYLDLSRLSNASGTVSDSDLTNIQEAYENNVAIAYYNRAFYSIVYFGHLTTNNYTIALLETNSQSSTAVYSCTSISISGSNYTKSGKTLVFYVNGDGTKFLSNNGTYVTPPNATTSVAGYMSAADKTRLNNAIVPTDVNIVDSSASSITIVGNKYNTFVTYTSSTVLPIATTPSGTYDRGSEWIISVYNNTSADIAQPLPNNSNWIVPAESITVSAGSWAEISIRYLGDSKFFVKI